MVRVVSTFKVEEQATNALNTKRTEQLIEVLPDIIAVACPYCTTMITDGVKGENKQDEVKVLEYCRIDCTEQQLLKQDGCIILKQESNPKKCFIFYWSKRYFTIYVNTLSIDPPEDAKVWVHQGYRALTKMNLEKSVIF